MPIETWQTERGWIAQENDLQVIADSKEKAIELLKVAQGQKFIEIKY